MEDCFECGESMVFPSGEGRVVLEFPSLEIDAGLGRVSGSKAEQIFLLLLTDTARGEMKVRLYRSGVAGRILAGKPGLYAALRL
jgi:hypothetical protein